MWRASGLQPCRERLPAARPGSSFRRKTNKAVVKISKQQEVFNLIQSLTGQKNILTIPRELINYTGSLETGLFLSQLIYWCDRGGNKQGWIYKTYKEWQEEICLTEYAIRKSARQLKDMGILETKIKKANGNPTVHYRLNISKFADSFLRFQRNQTANTKERNFENEGSLTETTTEIKTEKNNKGVATTTPCTFEEFCNSCWVDNDIVDTVIYYLNEYENEMGRQHPRLKEEQWERVTDKIISFYDGKLEVDFGDLDMDSMKRIIDKHFRTEYKNCDYHILHFVSDGVKVRRMYEVAY